MTQWKEIRPRAQSFISDQLVVDPAAEGFFEALQRGLHQVIRPVRDYLSGLTIRLDDPFPLTRDHILTVYRPEGAGIVREREILISRHHFIPSMPLHIYWEPIVLSAGVRFFVSLCESPRLTRAPFNLKHFALEGGDSALIHSTPYSDLTVPYGIGFSPVTQCNLNCIHCISRFSRKSVSVMDDFIWKELSGHIAEGRLCDISSDYSGDIMNSHRRHGGWLNKIIDSNVAFRIDTHANDLTPEIAELLIRSRLYSICFSVDSLDPAQYKIIRKGGNLDAVLTNIRHFMDLRNRVRPELETLISFVLMNQNTKTFRLAIDFAAELKFSWIQGNHLIVFTEDLIDSSMMLDPAAYKDFHDEMTVLAQEKGVTISLPAPAPPRKSLRGHAPCSMPWGGVQILGNGDVMACCIPGTKVGNLHEERLEAIWNGPVMRDFRSRVNTDTPPDACAVCPMYRLPNNYASYVPGLDETQRQAFEARILDVK